MQQERGLRRKGVYMVIRRHREEGYTWKQRKELYVEMCQMNFCRKKDIGCYVRKLLYQQTYSGSTASFSRATPGSTASISRATLDSTASISRATPGSTASISRATPDSTGLTGCEV